MIRLYQTSNPIISREKFQLVNVNNAVLGAGLSVTKRPKLSDYKPITDLFTVKSLFSIFLRAALLPMNVVLDQYNRFLMQQEKKIKAGYIDDYEEFDWNGVLHSNYNKFLSELCRLFSASFIRKVMEELCIDNYSLKIADKLTKDVQKSALRKAIRLSDRYAVCQQIFHTSLWSSALGYGSFFIYDVAYRFFEAIQQSYTVWKKRGFVEACKQWPVVDLTIFGVKKVILTATTWSSSSLGFAIGCYFDVKYGGVVGSVLLDLLSNIAVNFVLNRF
jgi:hypothetical protein